MRGNGEKPSGVEEMASVSCLLRKLTRFFPVLVQRYEDTEHRETHHIAFSITTQTIVISNLTNLFHSIYSFQVIKSSLKSRNINAHYPSLKMINQTKGDISDGILMSADEVECCFLCLASQCSPHCSLPNLLWGEGSFQQMGWCWCWCVQQVGTNCPNHPPPT